jgi:nitrile hydratase accessory protein
MTHEALPELPELPRLPGMPLDADSPVFNEPWEARAFAMVLALHQRGLFTWPQWAAALSRQITQSQTAGDADLGDTYYQHWLLALESLVTDLPLPRVMASPPP